MKRSNFAWISQELWSCDQRFEHLHRCHPSSLNSDLIYFDSLNLFMGITKICVVLEIVFPENFMGITRHFDVDCYLNMM